MPLALLTTEHRPVAAILALAWLAAACRTWRWPMLLDGALIATYTQRPVLWPILVALVVVRWTPPLSAIVARALGVPSWGGLSLPVALFVLPGLRAFVRGQERPRAATGATICLETPRAATPALMSLASLLAYVNDRPDEVPHLAIIGPSGSGKTTLATAVLGSRPGAIVVLTAKEGDAWGGLAYVGIDDDASYTTARQTFGQLESEVKTRLLRVKNHGAPGETMTIVLDDFSTLQAECPNAALAVKIVARLGRSLKMRLVMLSDSALVKAIGLEGEGETRGNFAFVRLDRGHAAAVEIGGELIACDLRGVERARVALAGRGWQAGHAPAQAPVDTARAQRIATYRAWRAAGVKRDQARAIRQAEGNGIDDAEWAEAGLFAPSGGLNRATNGAHTQTNGM